MARAIRRLGRTNTANSKFRGGAVTSSLAAEAEAIARVGQVAANTLALLRACAWRSPKVAGLISEDCARAAYCETTGKSARAWRQQRAALLKAGLLRVERNMETADGSPALRVVDFRRGTLVLDQDETVRRLQADRDTDRELFQAELAAKQRELEEMRAELERERQRTAGLRARLSETRQEVSSARKEVSAEIPQPVAVTADSSRHTGLETRERETTSTPLRTPQQGDGGVRGRDVSSERAPGPRASSAPGSWRCVRNVTEPELRDIGAMLERFETARAEQVTNGSECDRLRWLTMAVHARAGRSPGGLFRSLVLRWIENGEDTCTQADEDAARRWLIEHERPGEIQEREYSPDDSATLDAPAIGLDELVRLAQEHTQAPEDVPALEAEAKERQLASQANDAGQAVRAKLPEQVEPGRARYEMEKKAAGGRSDRDLSGGQSAHPKTASAIADKEHASTVRRWAADDAEPEPPDLLEFESEQELRTWLRDTQFAGLPEPMRSRSVEAAAKAVREKPGKYGARLKTADEAAA